MGLYGLTLGYDYLSLKAPMGKKKAPMVETVKPC